MHSIIAFATQWGSKYGGINTFNTDFLSAFGVAFHTHVQVICIVTATDEKEIEAAKNTHVTLIKLPYSPKDKTFTAEQASAAITELKNLSIDFNPTHTIWLGHDRISGEAAVHAAKQAGGRSALIHHMSYDAYEAFAEDSQTAYAKTQNQKALFKQADLVLAVGPSLCNALSELLDMPKDQVHTIIPGLAEIEPRKTTPITFSAFLSGRLSDDAVKIKQGHLGVAAFAKAIAEAQKNHGPESLVNRSKIVLRGVDFESRQHYGNNQPQPNPEKELHDFAEGYAGARINLQALPYTQDREELYDNLKSASVALMPSWHEGFGLVAWEAIAAGVPLIISKDSGVYEFLKQACQGTEAGFVNAIKVRGSNQPPYFNNDDLNEVAEAIKNIASDPTIARSRAALLRNMLGDYTWPACVENVVKHFDWNIQKGSLKTTGTESSSPVATQTDSTETVEPQSPLQMPVKHWKPGCGIAESQLLRADEALVPFDSARQPVIEQLNTWLDDPQYPQAIRLITGAGGLGKTRLAIEICQQRRQSGWHCGFLGKSHLAKDIPTVWQALLGMKQPVLLVLDYAETRQAVLLAFIKAIIKKPGGHPVRLLLLARDSGEWWDNLPGKDAECEVLLNGYATSGPFVLPELYLDEASRFDAYKTALQAYADAIGAAVSDVKPDLGGEHFSKPLYLQMAALLALFGERPATADGLTKALLNHERRYWIDALMDTGLHKPESLAQRLLVLATLTGGFVTPKQAKTVWDAASDDSLEPGQFNALFNALVPLYPGKQGLQAVQPDILGEALVAQALLQRQGEKLLDAVLGNNASPSFQHAALTVIARLSVHRPDLHTVLVSSLSRNFCHCCREIINVAVETPSGLPALAQTAFMDLSTALKSQAAGLLAPFFKNESVELAHLALGIQSFETEKSEKKLAKKSNDINIINAHACYLGKLAVAFYRVGDNEQALNFAEQALAIHRRQAQKNPDRLDPDYAVSLSNYAGHLRNAGRDEEALDFAEQALAIRQRLAKKNPDRLDPDYATSLSNYASHLSDGGRDEEAIGCAEQALAIRQRLAQKNPDRFDPGYATSLSNYAGHLSDAGRDEEALGCAEQALAIRQRLAQKNPDRFDPYYATSLSNYARFLSDADRSEEALGCAEQALAIHRRLAQKNPDRFDSDYTTSLNNCAKFLSDAGRDVEALDCAEQALAIRQRLAQKNPDRFDPGYATSLSNYASLLSNAGRDEEALGCAEQALAIRQRLAQKNPDLFDPDYATSLSNYASHLSDAGLDEEALDFAEQALAIYQRLAQKNPARYEFDCYSTLCTALFLDWLANKTLSSNVDREKITNIPDTIAAHKKSESLFYSLFVQACMAEEQRAELFKQTIINWRALSKADQHQLQNYFLCVCAWINQHDPVSLPEHDWLNSWHKFRQQRQGRLPIWMQTLAHRLDFKWPD